MLSGWIRGLGKTISVGGAAAIVVATVHAATAANIAFFITLSQAESDSSPGSSGRTSRKWRSGGDALGSRNARGARDTDRRERRGCRQPRIEPDERAARAEHE